MNVADLLHDAPSDDRSRRHPRNDPPLEPPPHQQQPQQQQQQPPQPPHHPPHHSPPLDRPRDHPRERDRPPQDGPHPSLVQQSHPLRRSPPPFLAGRPPSPPRHGPPFGAPPPPDFQGVHHLPPPSTLLQEPYESAHRSRRANNEVMPPHPHERLGPPPGPSAPVQPQPYVVEHRSSSSKSHTSPHPSSHHHHHYHAHTLPGTPSSMHMPPPPQRSLHASPPHAQHIHGPGQGSIPLFPTPVGPGVPPGGQPHLPPPSGPPHSSSAMSMRIDVPSPMYNAPPQGPSPPHPHTHHTHSRSSSSLDRARGRGSSTSSAPSGPVSAFDIKSNTASPVMASLQRPSPYDERDGREREPGPGMSRPRGPLSGTLGPGIPSGSSLPSMAASGRPQDTVTHLLPGPGLHPTALSEKRERERERERERGMERTVPMDRERDRRSSNASVHDSPGSIRREREQRERQAMKERERYAQQQQREREMREQEMREQEMRRERRAKERGEREMQMMREQEAQMQMQAQAQAQAQAQREQQEREREREQRERERMREREQREREQQQRDQDFRIHAHGMMGMSVGLGLGAGMPMSVAERERLDREERDREWLQKAQQMEARGVSRQHQHQHQHAPPPPPPMQTMGPPPAHGQGQVWPRFVTPSGPSPEDERRMQEREMQRLGMEDVRREIEWETGKVERQPGRSSKSRTSTKDREREDRERTKDAQREERRRSSARDKEREREKLELEMQQQEREREREHRMRERDLALQKEAQYELMERERLQRQRDLADMETIRAVRAREEQMQMQQLQAQGQVHGAPPQQHIHHVHPHHHQHPPVPPQHLKGQPGKQGPMGPGPIPQDLPPQYQHERERDFRQGPSKGVPLNQIGMPPPHLAQGMPMPHPMGPGSHMRPPPDMYPPPPGAHVGYPGRRPSPPPGHGPPPPSLINPAYMFPRSSSPSTPPVLAQRHLGTFIFPRTPFPFFDFPAPTDAESGAPAEPLDIRATLYLPARFIPLTRPARPRIWGGALIPAVPPLTGAQRALCQQYTPANSQFGRPWPDEVREGRRVYTDDSDLFLCALHAGWVSWSAARRARREGRDLVMEVRLTREARYIGGYGSPLRARDRERERERGEEELGSEDDGSSLLSSGWGNGHDGAGLEVLSAQFVLPGTAHSFGLRNRSQRLLEYAERRCALGCAPKLGRKRRRVHGPAFGYGESAVQLKLDLADEELSATRVMVFGTDSSWPEIGFKYHPDALRSILFPQSTPDGRPSKRRKLAAIADNAPADTPPPTDRDSASEDELVTQRAVVVETLWESFLISQRGQIPAGEGEPESDKENTASTATSGDGAGRRYVIALLTNAGGTAGKLPRKPPPASAKTAESEDQSKSVPVSVPEGEQPPPLVNVDAAAQSGAAAPGEHENADAASKEGGPASASASTSPSQPVADPPPSTSASASAPSPAPQPQHEEREREQSKLSEESVDYTDEADGNGPIQILHRDLGEENFEFLPDGINVLSSEVVNGMRKGWKLEARQWKWVQVGVTS
ncbi:hypothetical protein L226DRAFT_536624 [Lentinus tigrinus ALCF2SS1-7]|uniref:Uncharacterized protein n=1 Tax=Lentinus tigrinus ALCF2SS1-6 TaxID=1328759 RepID=A0A5C2S1G4_9APHY|nr:hypothetical protein L227DRAFT_578125 [Lentinus tigrinus ALCF2SS1-6]RPD73125.1 hypothetical protein L226DRAFT_536624 [Lentinus tigrinus ALCF2SS1-7]